MMNTRSFTNADNAVLVLSGASAVLSVVTTIGIHSFITGPSTFEESLTMYKTGYYIFAKWFVIAHCLFVIFSVYGLSRLLTSSAFSRIGFLFYTAFGLTEIFRMLLILHYLGALRDRYLAEPALQDSLRIAMDSFFGISEALFTAFTLFILLGNLFLGLACLELKGLIKTLGIALLIWALVLAISLINVYQHAPGIESGIHYFSLTMQPLIRLLIGLAIFRELWNRRRVVAGM